MAKKRKRRIIRRNPGKPRNMYFNASTQDAIIEYQNCTCDKDRELLYRDKIQKAFETLAESLIFVYGFNSPYESLDSMKLDCVSFLFETIAKWDPSRGTKAFSYFNVVAKNWLIIRSRNHRRDNLRHVSLSDHNAMSAKDKFEVAASQMVESPEVILRKEILRSQILEVLELIKAKLTKEKELACINAIKIVFENIDQLDFLNKRAIYVYVRDISGLSPKQLSVAMSKIRKHYKDIVHVNRDVDLF